MKFERIIIVSLVVLLVGVILFAGKPSSNVAYDPLYFYDHLARINRPMKIWVDTITPSTSNGYSLDISSAAFSKIMSISAIAGRNTATATSVANVGVKSYTTTAVVFNSTEGNASLVNVLGSNVLLGPSTGFASTSGLLLHVTVIGY